MKSKIYLGALFVAGLLALSTLFGSFYVVEEGERAVITRLGKVQSVEEPGLHYKTPFITEAHTISTRNLVTSFENLDAYTTDSQIATVEAIHVTYLIPANRVAEVYSNFGSAKAVVDQYVGRRVNSEIEKVFGRFTAERSVKERALLSQQIGENLKDIPANAPIEILSIEVASIAFPPEYTDRINARMSAEVEVAKKMQEVLQADQDRLKAQHEADAVAYGLTSKAEAEAAAIRVRGVAEAESIKLKSAALASNPALVELTKAERWNGVLPTTMIPNSTVPFMEMQK